MRLQLGQTIIWDGCQQIVTAVSETHARIATRQCKNALKILVIERGQNEIFGKKPGSQEPVQPEKNWPDDLLEFMTAVGGVIKRFKQHGINLLGRFGRWDGKLVMDTTIVQAQLL